MLRVMAAQVEECTIEFNAKISSTSIQENVVKTQKEESSSKDSISGFIWFTNTTTKTTIATQTTAKNSNTEQRAFSMRVMVKAVQDDVPSGMQKILNALGDAIQVEQLS